MSGRFQFSLRTLLLLAITAGALMGFFFLRRENAKLRLDIERYRDELGSLEISDPAKAYIRAIPVSRMNHFRFRVYVPGGGQYRLGIQTKDVSPVGKGDDFNDMHVTVQGEFIIELSLTFAPDGSGIYELGTMGTESPSWQRGNFHWKVRGTSAQQYEIHSAILTDLRTVEFDHHKPFKFLTLYATVPSKGTRIQDDPGDGKAGLKLWIEPEPH